MPEIGTKRWCNALVNAEPQAMPHTNTTARMPSTLGLDHPALLCRNMEQRFPGTAVAIVAVLRGWQSSRELHRAARSHYQSPGDHSAHSGQEQWAHATGDRCGSPG